jgi:hypothetical protein
MPTYIQTIKNQGIFLKTGTVTILNGASLSDSIYLENRHFVGMIMPSAWTTASISFLFSSDDVNFYNTYSLTAALTASTGATIADAIINIATTATFHGARYLKLRSGTALVPVTQGADRVLTIISMID